MSKDIKKLTDEQLLKLLKQYGEDVGPVTSQVRHLYEKRLFKLRKELGFIKGNSPAENIYGKSRKRPRKSFSLDPLADDSDETFTDSRHGFKKNKLHLRSFNGSSIRKNPTKTSRFEGISRNETPIRRIDELYDNFRNKNRDLLQANKKKTSVFRKNSLPVAAKQPSQNISRKESKGKNVRKVFFVRWIFKFAGLLLILAILYKIETLRIAYCIENKTKLSNMSKNDSLED